MWREEDKLVAIRLRFLRISALKQVYLRAGAGVSFRAKEIPNGYELFLRRSKDTQPALKFTVRTAVLPNSIGRTGKYLICAKCQKRSHRHLYLDWDTVTARCSDCLGIDKSRTVFPIRKMQWDYNDQSKFRSVVRRVVYADAVRVQMVAMKEQGPEEFFLGHPYLVPPFFEVVKGYDFPLYQKMLKELKRKYMYALKTYNGPKTKRVEKVWLDRQLEERVAKGYFMNEKESRWLQQKLSEHSKKRESQPGTTPDPSSSPLPETGCSLSKTPSSPGTSAGPATEPESGRAQNAAEPESTPLKDGNVDAQTARGTVSLSVVSAEGKEPCLSSLSNPSAGPVPEELSLAATR